MLIRICDICFTNGGKVSKSTAKASQGFFHNAVRVTADVCDEHKDYLKSMPPADLPKVIDGLKTLEPTHTTVKKVKKKNDAFTQG